MKRKHFAWWKNFPSWSYYLRVNGFPDRSSREIDMLGYCLTPWECNSLSSLSTICSCYTSWGSPSEVSLFFFRFSGWMDYFGQKKSTIIIEVAWRHWINRPTQWLNGFRSKLLFFFYWRTIRLESFRISKHNSTSAAILQNSRLPPQGNVWKNRSNLIILEVIKRGGTPKNKFCFMGQ